MICLSLCTIGLDVELETNVIVEEGERRRPYIEPGHDAFDDNVINAAGEIGIQWESWRKKLSTNDKTNETNGNLELSYLSPYMFNILTWFVVSID